ncbi:MAG TPA: nickel-binding protein [Puia sp.]|nr:nickel-binding protein [Puia sp.]
MPIYMDIHHVPGAEALDLAEAHRKDMLIQDDYQCKAMTYWLDANRGVAFCLIEAPDKSIVEEMHRMSHGLVPHKVIEVRDDLVESFLGRITDPQDAALSANGLKVFSDPAFRVLLVTDRTDTLLLQHRLGRESADQLLKNQHAVIRQQLFNAGGREVEHSGHGFIASFASAATAVACALQIRENLSEEERNLAGFSMVINAGEPVEKKSDQLFGDTLQLARQLNSIIHQNRIVISAAVKALLGRDYPQMDQQQFLSLPPQDEALLSALFATLEKNWQECDFDVTEFCQAMAMSKSQLYRKTIFFWGMPPNLLLREFRLNKARELLRKQSFNIAQATFDCGFSSPSYFTKCFKKKYGLLPAVYQDLLQ